MSNKQNNMVVSAMNYAIPLGLFWVIKYLFVIMGDYNDTGKYINSLLSIGTPVLYYILLCRYRDKTLGGSIEYGNSILFSLLLFMFASFLEIAIVSLHIFVINPAYLSHFSQQLHEFAERFSMGNENFMEQMKLFTSNMGGYYLSSWLLSNMFLGLFLSLILGYFVSRQKPGQSQKM